jgi:hypothetical protein
MQSSSDRFLAGAAAPSAAAAAAAKAPLPLLAAQGEHTITPSMAEIKAT